MVDGVLALHHAAALVGALRNRAHARLHVGVQSVWRGVVGRVDLLLRISPHKAARLLVHVLAGADRHLGHAASPHPASRRRTRNSTFFPKGESALHAAGDYAQRASDDVAGASRRFHAAALGAGRPRLRHFPPFRPNVILAAEMVQVMELLLCKIVRHVTHRRFSRCASPRTAGQAAWG